MTKGWKTSEFWLTALFNGSALLTVVAGIVPAQTAPLVVAAAGIVTALYNFGRSMVKAGNTNNTSLIPIAQGNTTGPPATNARVASAAAAENSPQRRATDKMSPRDVVGLVERAALQGVVQSVTHEPNSMAEQSEGSEVFDERNAG